MQFNSVEYICFLLIACAAYFALPRRLKNGFLLAASYFFYMCWNAKYALLMLFATAVAYAGAVLIEDYPARKKLWLGLSLCLSIGVLFFFKYTNFAIDTVNALSGVFGSGLYIKPLDILLPVGISFFTLQAIGYTVDVYRAKLPAERNFFRFALFVAFFPQLVAGPIERAPNLMGQFGKYHKFDFMRAKEGLLLIGGGLIKKMVLADRLAMIVNPVYNNAQSYSGFSLIFATAAFAFQIYCDFSAYSDIARGSARILGFELMQNFNAPYLSSSIKEFWRNWHISLSTWFKDYLYIPLGGSRKGFWRTQLNLVIVFAVSGLWHGAGMTFLIWGLLNGLYQVAGNILDKRLKLPGMKFIAIPLTFVLCCFAWVFFRANSFSDAIHIVSRMFVFTEGIGASLFSLAALSELCVVGVGLVLLTLLDYVSKGQNLIKNTLSYNAAFRWAIGFAVVFIVLILGIYGEQYLPQSFLYFQF